MSENIYRITGRYTGYGRGDGERQTIRRGGSNYALAYYESLDEVKRALAGFKGNKRDYVDFQVEVCKMVGIAGDEYLNGEDDNV